MDTFGIDVVFTGGHILTMDDNDTEVEAVAVRGEKIVEVGNAHEIRKHAGANAALIDLQGKTMIPGFIEAHTHVDMYGMMTSDLVVDCRIPPLRSAGEILDKIREKASSTPRGQLILGQGRPFQQYPNKDELDKVVPENPLVIKPSMHWYLLNTAALKYFRISADRPTFEEIYEVDPCGAIQRDFRTGEPTGYVEEIWNYMFPNSRSPYLPEETERVIHEGVKKHVRWGVTSITEFMDYPESPRVYQRIRQRGELPARLQIVPCFHGLYKTVDLQDILKAGLMSGFGDEWIKFGGVKIFVDRQQHTTCSSSQLQEWFSRSHRAGLRVYMHAITRKGQDMALAAIEGEAAMSGLEEIRTMRHRIEHMGNEYHDPTYYPRVKELGAIALPTAYFMNMGPNKLLTPKTDRSFIFRTLLEMGLCTPGNSDGGGAFPEGPNPLYQIWCMVNRKALDGTPVCPAEKISVRDAMRVYTRHSAYAAREENVKGSIEPGKLADFAVLAENPLTCPEEHLRDIDVLMTIVGGKIMYEKK